MAHVVMLNAINSNHHTARRRPLHLERDMYREALSQSNQWRRNMSSLPSEFVTGQEGITNPRYQLEPEQETDHDIHPCLRQ